jgi:hypothetical protein
MKRASGFRRALASATISGFVVACAAHDRPNPIDVAQRFTEARASGDLDAARAMLAADPRLWWEEKAGPGDAWSLEGGRWSGWDEHFRGQATYESWTFDAERSSASAVCFETNDYFRLLELPGSRFRVTYFFDEDRRITGRLIAAIEGGSASRGLESEFEAWARENHPEEWAYLRPGGQIDPTGDRPMRTRALLETWRASTGRQRVR